MIVQEPPYDLVALFADLDMQKLSEALIERGQEPRRRCVREIRWRSQRDPRRDTVWREPDRALAPFLGMDALFLPAWDRIKKIVCSERKLEPPLDEDLLEMARRSQRKKMKSDSVETALAERPKEMFSALVEGHNRLRRSAPLYATIGKKVSLPEIKRSAPATRVVDGLRAWFPWEE